MFLWKSSFSSPWRPPHSEAGTETGESTGWTLSLHLWRCTHRGLGKSPQTSHKSQDCLKSSALPCCYPCTSIRLCTCPRAARSQVLAVQSGSHHLRRARPNATRLYVYVSLIYTQNYAIFLRTDRLWRVVSSLAAWSQASSYLYT